MRLVRKGPKKTAIFKSHRRPGRPRALEQTAQGGIVFTLVADVNAAQDLARSKRFIDGMNPVDDIVEVDSRGTAFGASAYAPAIYDRSSDLMREPSFGPSAALSVPHHRRSSERIVGAEKTGQRVADRKFARLGRIIGMRAARTQVRGWSPPAERAATSAQCSASASCSSSRVTVHRMGPAD